MRWIIEAPLKHGFLAVRDYNGRREFFWTQEQQGALTFASELEADNASMAVQALAADLFNFAVPVTGDTKSVPAF